MRLFGSSSSIDDLLSFSALFRSDGRGVQEFESGDAGQNAVAILLIGGVVFTYKVIGAAGILQHTQIIQLRAVVLNSVQENIQRVDCVRVDPQSLQMRKIGKLLLRDELVVVENERFQTNEGLQVRNITAKVTTKLLVKLQSSKDSFQVLVTNIGTKALLPR